MKKLIIALVILCSLAMVNTSFAADSGQPPKEATGSGAFRVSLWPNVWCWPATQNIYGLALGIGNYNEAGFMAGLDLALITSMTDRVEGLRISILNNGKDSDGAEIGVANLSEKFNGAQISVFNKMTKDSNGFQIGVVNQSEDSRGLQIGLICMMDNGFIPMCPIFNFGFEKKK